MTCHATAGGPATTFATGFSEVRGLAFDGTHLYVADVGADTVTIYDGTGAKVGTLDVKRPVHLLFDASGWLWIGSERGKVAAGPATTVRRPRRRPPRRGLRLRHRQGAAGDVVKVVHGASTGLDHTAGLCLVAGPTTKSATLLVASRVGRRILAYPIDLSHHSPSWSPQTSKTVLGSDVLPDDPDSSPHRLALMLSVPSSVPERGDAVRVLRLPCRIMMPRARTPVPAMTAARGSITARATHPRGRRPRASRPSASVVGERQAGGVGDRVVGEDGDPGEADGSSEVERCGEHDDHRGDGEPRRAGGASGGRRSSRDRCGSSWRRAMASTVRETPGMRLRSTPSAAMPAPMRTTGVSQSSGDVADHEAERCVAGGDGVDREARRAR